ncbi:hypothetical protein [Maribacter polysiphoniae]|uniref:hypothetical protein n=1 Tax=Maribacter polysiphoniae TaxID=429344 RepID=UPI002354C3E4|nr:hypothetical protein [Maribacter polysiphoniae]
MEKNKKFTIFSIGILFGAFFPYGIWNLVYKVLERVLFNTDFNTFLASGIAAYTGAIFTIFCFSRISDYLMQFDYSDIFEVKKAFWLGILANGGLFLIWFLIPLIDGLLGQGYMDNLNNAYQTLDSNFILGKITINQGSSFLCFFGIVVLIYKKINTRPAKSVTS